MIALWQAERAEDKALRDSLCTHATELLDVPNERIDDELLAAFVETRGLVLLASGDARLALAYLEEQIHHFGRGGWIGIQLGGERARIVLGLPSDADDTIEAPSSQSARFALHVARVIGTLSRAAQQASAPALYALKGADFRSFHRPGIPASQRPSVPEITIPKKTEGIGESWFVPFSLVPKLHWDTQLSRQFIGFKRLV